MIRLGFFYWSVFPCIGSVSEFGHVGGWVLLWFSWMRFVECCFYLVPFTIDDDFWSDDRFGLCCLMIWIGCLGG